MFGIENQQDRSITSGRKSGPRSSHIAALVSEPDSEVVGSNPGGGKFFCVIMNNFSYEISQNRWNDWIYYNTLVFLFICSFALHLATQLYLYMRSLECDYRITVNWCYFVGQLGEDNPKIALTTLQKTSPFKQFHHKLIYTFWKGMNLNNNNQK